MKSGKGVCTTDAVKALMAKKPELKVFVIDPNEKNSRGGPSSAV
jgi:hypothetical protein